MPIPPPPDVTADSKTGLSSFFISGGTLPLSAPSYVTRDTDQELLATLLRGEYCYLLNTRQMGKSSLCVRTIARLKEHSIRTVFLDLTKFGGQGVSREQWYAGLLAEIGRDLGLRKELLTDYKQNSELPPVQRLFGALELALESLPDPIVVFVDEVDAAQSLPFSGDEFFAGIRECCNRRATDQRFTRLTFCLLGAASPAELVADTRLSPFNVGQRLVLSDFSSVEASPLAAGLGANGQVLLRRVLHWTNGHPYLTQRLCQSLAIDVMEGKTPTVRDVDRACEALFLSATARDADSNLSFLRKFLLSHPIYQRADLLEWYGKIRAGKRVTANEANAALEALRLSGVVRTIGKSNRLQVRNRIYERVFDSAWIRESLPSGEVRRQQQAYRQGTLRTLAGMAAFVIAVSIRWYFANLPPDIPEPPQKKVRWSARRANIIPMDGPNAVHFYSAAADAATDELWEFDFYGHSTKSGWVGPSLSEKRALIHSNQQTLALLRQGFRYRYQGLRTRMRRDYVDGFDAPTVNFIACRQMGRMLGIEAQVRKADGNTAAAMESCLDAVRLGSDIATDSNSIVQNAIGMMVMGIGVEEMPHHIDGLTLGEARKAIQRLSTLIPSHTLLQQAMQGERTLILAAFRKFFSRPATSIKDFSNYGLVENSFESYLSYQFYVFVYGYDGIYQDFNTWSQQTIERLGLPYQKEKQLPPQIQPSIAVNRIVSPDLRKLQTSWANRETGLHLLLLKLAIHGYRQEHRGSVPPTLDTLTQGSNAYLKAIPTDPFSMGGKTPLRYKNGVAYSVGENGRDEGGRGDDVR